MLDLHEREVINKQNSQMKTHYIWLYPLSGRITTRQNCEQGDMCDYCTCFGSRLRVWSEENHQSTTKETQTYIRVMMLDAGTMRGQAVVERYSR